MHYPQRPNRHPPRRLVKIPAPPPTPARRARGIASTSPRRAPLDVLCPNGLSISRSLSVGRITSTGERPSTSSRSLRKRRLGGRGARGAHAFRRDVVGPLGGPHSRVAERAPADAANALAPRWPRSRNHRLRPGLLARPRRFADAGAPGWTRYGRDSHRRASPRRDWRCKLNVRLGSPGLGVVLDGVGTGVAPRLPARPESFACGQPARTRSAGEVASTGLGTFPAFTALRRTSSGRRDGRRHGPGDRRGGDRRAPRPTTARPETRSTACGPPPRPRMGGRIRRDDPALHGQCGPLGGRPGHLGGASTSAPCSARRRPTSGPWAKMPSSSTTTERGGRGQIGGLGSRRTDLTSVWTSGPGHVWIGGEGVVLSLGGKP